MAPCYNAQALSFFMLIISSSAKTLDVDSAIPNWVKGREPHFIEEADRIRNGLAKLEMPELKKVLGVNEKLAQLNFERYQKWSSAPERPALYLYKGDVFRELEVETYEADGVDYAGDHVFVMSGLYGAVNALDAIKPYRLEMNAKLKEAKQAMNLQWQDAVTDYFNEWIQKHKFPCLLNLASVEYAKAVNPAKLCVPIIHVDFKEERDGELKTVGIFAKRARGMMINYCIQNKVQEPDELHGFNVAGYEFMGEKDGHLLFAR